MWRAAGALRWSSQARGFRHAAMTTTAQPLNATQPAISFGVRVRVLAVFVGLGLGVVAVRTNTVGAVRDTYVQSLASALAQEGLKVEAASVHWLDVPGRVGARPVMFVAHRGKELTDIYYAEARVAGESAVLDVLWLRNVTRTSSAAEHDLVRVGPYLAFATQVGDTHNAIEILDTRGEAPALTENWPRRAKIQNWIRNLQETGRGDGFGRRRYQLVPAASTLTMTHDADRLALMVDETRVVIDPRRTEPLEGAERLELRPTEEGMPGTITWVVDTIRNLSFVGPTPIEWLEHTVFGITDRVSRTYHQWVETDTEAEVKEALAMPVISEAAREELLRVTDPELGFPPAPLTPMLERKVRGEGQWIPVADPDFVNSYPGAPTAFYQTFLRVDPERDFTRVYITMWDPRMVQLGIVMGTQEPESATGETGSGMIPRDDFTLRHVVAGFNGGFQAIHGEFGMMADGHVYLPPKPFAATVAVSADGRVGMGSWPGPTRGVEWNEESANAQIPSDMVSMRQNLTSVVEDKRFNPWERWWWGAAPPWAEEQTYIHRSGLCLTEQGFMAYLWGDSLGPAELGQAMVALSCVRGMHLDMNSKHTGFEFYKPIATRSITDVAPPKLSRPLAESEFEGTVTKAKGYTFRARLGVTTMSPMAFPRYLERDRRDYFYLTLKPVLPGRDLDLDGLGVSFSTTGLPHAGFPHAFARAEPPPVGGVKRWIVRIDPTRAVPQPLATAHQVKALGYLSEVSTTEGSVALLRRVVPGSVARFHVGEAPSRSDVVVLRGEPLLPDSIGTAAIGADEEGFLVYAEIERATPGLLYQTLSHAGVREAVLLGPSSRLTFVADAKTVSVDGTSEVQTSPPTSLGLLAEERPPADVLFPDTEPRPYRRWGWLQDKRVRYFPRTASPRFRAPEEQTQ